MGFVFFDTETTGLRHGFDQIVHFAAIRTDNDLNEVDRFEARSRLLPHVVPHPNALLTNGLSIERLTDKGLPTNYEMVSLIRRKLLSWSPSIFVGYNSIRFDEEMLRHSLFQNLHPAFLTSNHGNCRADALGLMLAASALSPSCLMVPVGPDGRPIFRLDQLASANGVVHAKAHDAIADVIATVGLCRHVYKSSSELWQRFVRFSKKATVGEFVESEYGFFLTEFFGNEAYHTPVVCLGPDPDQPNVRLCLRLDEVSDDLSFFADEALHGYLSGRPSPIRKLRINAGPVLTPFYDASEMMLKGSNIDELEDRARRIKEDAAFCSRTVSSYVSTRELQVPSIHLEGRIYDGFPGLDDERRAASFHSASWPEALAIVQSLEDERLRYFGLRLIYFGGRDVMSNSLRLDVERELTDRLVIDGVGGLSLDQALHETEALLAEDKTGLVAVWCRSFDSVMCNKGDEPWAQSGRMSFARMRCGLR
jgi:exodeoxyribonuclease I